MLVYIVIIIVVDVIVVVVVVVAEVVVIVIIGFHRPPFTTKWDVSLLFIIYNLYLLSAALTPPLGQRLTLQRQTELVICWRVGRPCRGTWTGWVDGPRPMG